MSEKTPAEIRSDYKFFNLSHNLFKLALVGSFLGLIIPIIVWMYRDYYYINPFVPENSPLTGTDLYGRNMEGSLQSTLTMFLIESVIVLIVLLPYSFSRFYWIRLLLLQGLYGFWVFMLMLGAMHSSSLFGINLVGVLGINLLIFIWLIVTFIADMQNRKRLNNQWNKQSPNN